MSGLDDRDSDALLLVDRAGSILDLDARACRLLGYGRDELLGAHLAKIHLNGDAAVIQQRLRELSAEDAFVRRLEVRHCDGTAIPVEASAKVLARDGKGVIRAFLHDLRAPRPGEVRRFTSEPAPQTAQRLETLGRLTTSVAHDFNNILSAMSMQLEMLRLAPTVPPEELTRAVDELLGAATKAGNLTRQLLVFGRRAHRTERHELNAVVRGIVRLLRRIIGEHFSVQFAQDQRPLWFEGNPGLIEQVVMNLCINARDAMPDGGELTVATGRLELDEREASRRQRPAGRYVWLRVTDTGCGIEPETLPRICEPFFTTKEPDKGTGLGLATVHSVVSGHRGWLDVESTPGQGSVFTVILPELAGTAVEPRAPEAAPPRRGDETILLVEDEAAIRRMTKLCLGQLGYRVIEAASGTEALRRWEDLGGRVDLLLTDIVMPGGVSGITLSDRLRELRPGLKVILTSGYSEQLDGRGQPGTKATTYLAKPYELRDLAAAVRSCFDDKA